MNSGQVTRVLANFKVKYAILNSTFVLSDFIDYRLGLF